MQSQFDTFFQYSLVSLPNSLIGSLSYERAIKAEKEDALNTAEKGGRYDDGLRCVVKKNRNKKELFCFYVYYKSVYLRVGTVGFVYGGINKVCFLFHCFVCEV